MSFSPSYKLVKLACGVHSVHSVAERETFHPVIGPAAEAEALYVNQLRLVERLRTHFQQFDQEFVIWDVGLGAAANALTVLRALRDVRARVRLVSFDHTLEPLRFALRHVAALGYFDGYEAIATRLAHAEERSVIFPNGEQSVHWQVLLGDFPTLLLQASARELPKPHVILFDAYSPAKNPAMWTLPLFQSLYRLLDQDRPCALPTYSRSTMLRVTLLLAGFFVGTGHATGEKEETTIAANVLELVSDPLDLRWLDRARRSHSAEPMRKPVYGQAPLTPEAFEKLQAHPQFRST